MKILLDTHALLWWLADDVTLSSTARKAIENSSNLVFVSAASTWEIGIKKALGKLEAPENLLAMIEENSFEPLPITLAHGEYVSRLSPHHSDPFDRVLIAQAILEGLTIVTRDSKFLPYGVTLLEA